jgi:GTPase
LNRSFSDDGNSLDFSKPELDTYIRQLTKAANILGADLSVIHYRQQLKTESNSHRAHVLIRKIAIQPFDILEQRIAVVGNVDAGKSTLLGVLTKDLLDDGRGKARINLFKHQHEIDSGRTSSVGMEIMGFNSKGQIVTSSLLGRQKLSWEDICDHSAKVLTFVDLAGHEKYLKTTVFGMTGCSPDFVMLMVSLNLFIIDCF